MRQFNQRLAAAGAASRFPASQVPAWLPKSGGQRLFQEYFVALDAAGAVRGAYILKHQEFSVRDRVAPLADFQLPISEGAIDRRYSPVAVQLLRDATARQPLLFGLGMGDYDQAVARLLVAAGWRMWAVPFFLRIVHPSRFLRNIVYLRRSLPRAVALDVLACTGAGWLGVRAVQRLRCPKPARRPVDLGRTRRGVWRLGRSALGNPPKRLRPVRGAECRNSAASCTPAATRNSCA